MKGNQRISNRNVKYILALIWLVCFLQFRNSYVSTNNNVKATLYLKQPQGTKNCVTSNYLNECLTFLNEREIEYVASSSQSSWSKHDVASSSIIPKMAIYGLNRFYPFILIKKQTNLNLKQTPRYFTKKFMKSTSKIDCIAFEEDPWTWNQLEHQNFQENMLYLISRGVDFCSDCSENPTK